MKNFFMDVNFKRIVNADRRVNQGLNTVAVTDTAYDVKAYDYDFLRITNGTAFANAVNLPDATTLPPGYDVKIQNVDGTLPTDVFASGTAIALKSIATGKTVGFRLLENSTAAGTWLLYSVQEDAAFPLAYVANFDATTNWGTAAGGVYTIAHSAATHGKGANPLAVIYENDSGVIKPVGADLRIDGTTGDISIVADQTVDMRFAGRLVVVQ